MLAALKVLTSLAAQMAWGLIKTSAFLVAWVTSVIVAMSSTAIMDGLSDIGASALGITTQYSKQKQFKAQTKKATRRVGKKITVRGQRILAVNTIGAAGGWIPVIGDVAAAALMTYEAVLICESVNDFQDLQRTIGMSPEPSKISETCQWARNEWASTPDWMKRTVEAKVSAELEDSEASDTGTKVWVTCMTNSGQSTCGKWIDLQDPYWHEDSVLKRNG
ncbi:MAG: hypothetical protein P8L39_10170 [Halioglobus sp.]|nr:hypothetical protein [Halioglobus sp.]